MKGVEMLRAAGWPEDVCRAVLATPPYSGVPRDTLMLLSAVLRATAVGFPGGLSLVTTREETLASVGVDSVRKKRSAGFARNVNRTTS
jgi:predicted hydrolase (HD superfamily)